MPPPPLNVRGTSALGRFPKSLIGHHRNIQPRPVSSRSAALTLRDRLKVHFRAGVYPIWTNERVLNPTGNTTPTEQAMIGVDSRVTASALKRS